MTAEPISFDDVHIGDTLLFLTRDNGFGGSGDSIERTGTVTGKTDKTITLRVGEGLAEYRLNSHGHGYTRMAGATARLRRADWTDRSVRRTGKIERRPYSAEHVLIQDYGHTVWALWTADPTKTADAVDLLDRTVETEIVVVLQRIYKRDGYGEAGWLMSDGGGGQDLVASNKRDAMKRMRQAITDYFNR